ncbi:MAG: hypothetical protein ACOX4L_02440 [Bacillota bacterium]
MDGFKERFDKCYGRYKSDLERDASRLKVKLIYGEMQKRKRDILKELKEIEKLEIEEQKRFNAVFMDILE